MLPVRLDVAVLHHVSLQVAGLGEGLVAHLAFVRPHALVRQQVRVQVTQLLEQLPTQVAPVRLDPIMPQNVCDQVILRRVGLLTHSALPALLVAPDVHIVALIYVDIETYLLGVGAGPIARRDDISVSRSGPEVFSWVENTRGEVHYRARHEVGIWEETVVQRGEVRRMEEIGRGGPHRSGTDRFLFDLHWDNVTLNSVVKPV